MINEHQVSEYVQREMPELNEKLASEQKSNNVYRVMQTLLDQTRDHVCSQNLDAANKCFALVERIYNKGNSIVKNAVENVYVFALENVIYQHCRDRARLIKIIPAAFHSLFVRQIVGSNI
jgi:aminoglycoside phosphotransferase (APT) family kinase protein